MDKQDKEQQPFNYRPMRGATQYAKYRGFYISQAAAADTRPIDTSSTLYTFKVENTLPMFLFKLKRARLYAFTIDVYMKIARWSSILVIAIAVFLLLQEKAKPLANVFLTTGDGRNYRVPAYVDIDDALKAKIPQEPRPQVGDYGLEKKDEQQTNKH